MLYRTILFLAALIAAWCCLASGAGIAAPPKTAPKAKPDPRSKAKANAKKPAPTTKPSVPLPVLAKASWVWTPEDGGSGDFVCYFRKGFVLPEKPAAATVLITADNGYELYVNGSLVGGDAGFGQEFWASVERYDIAHLLKAGPNAIAARGLNMGGPGGLVAAVRIDLKAGPLEIVTDASWKMSVGEDAQYTQAEYDDSKWQPARVSGKMGMAPWGPLEYGGVTSPEHGGSQSVAGFSEPPEDFDWPGGIVFLRGRTPNSSTRGAPQASWRIGGTKAYLEFDTIGPSLLGHTMWSLVPARPDGKLTGLLDAGKGWVGSPSVSHDGAEIYFSMAPEGEKFFHVYAMPAGGGAVRQITRGPHNDFDPEPLGDGRIVFSSTRIGSREEYHGNPGRSLFVMDLPTGQAGAGGANIAAITHHIVGDNEPKQTADGYIAFIRCDNFFERAKVETQIHAVHPDGTGGQVLLGPDRQAIGYDRATASEADAAWLRSYGFGSPAPLPDGRVACISSMGLVVSGNGSLPAARLHPDVPPMTISPLPDGRLVFTAIGGSALGVLEVDTGKAYPIHRVTGGDAHSVVYLGPRPRPPMVRSAVPPGAADNPAATGFLLCQSVFATKQTRADVARIRAVRIIEGRPFTARSAQHPYDHVGVEGVELGTVPLAPDGSFYVEVPADRALAIQAVDGEGRGVINEATWIYVRPGERRSCVGCHYQRESPPANQRGILALRTGPVKLTAQGGGHRFRANNAANGGVLNLQYDRFREVASIDLYPQEALAAGQDPTAMPPGRPTQVQALVAVLAKGDASARIGACRRLGIFRDRSAAGALAAALKDPDDQVRIAAGLALSSCGDRSSIPPLLAALDDPSPPAAQAAAVALGNLAGQDEPFDPYSPPTQRAKGAQAWRTLLAAGNLDAVEQGLIRQIASAQPVDVLRAAVALGHIGTEPGKAALRSFLANDVANDKHTDLRATLEALRALGYLRDASAVDLLAGVLNANLPRIPQRAHGNPEFGSLQRPAHLAGAAAEALGRIGTPQARAALLAACPKAVEFWHYTAISGDHGWLMGSHSSIPHFRIAEALDAIEGPSGMAARDAAPTEGPYGIVPMLLRSVPIDSDRAILLYNDDYETVTARVINRSGQAPAVLEACLAVLGDPGAQQGSAAPAGGGPKVPLGLSPALRAAVTASPPAVSTGALDAQSRAAQLLSVVCLEPRYAPRIRSALDRFRAQPASRARSWTCYFLARSLGKLPDPVGVESLMACLDKDATEASFGLVDPPNTFLHAAMTPCYRSAAAYALGLIGDRKAVPTLLRAVANFDNAMDVRQAAARALAMLADPSLLPELQKLAATYPEVATRRVLLEACKSVEAVAGSP